MHTHVMAYMTRSEKAMEVCSHLQSCGSWGQTLAVSLTASTFKLLDSLKAGKQVFQNNEHLPFF